MDGIKARDIIGWKRAAAPNNSKSPASRGVSLNAKEARKFIQTLTNEKDEMQQENDEMQQKYRSLEESVGRYNRK